ncbi:carbohydrate deacetylase [Streptococcus cuniculi]|uniref:Carbohydrate deacetylase n=1 Tax=Streptococcus cuniculi TaxID=1432788 RepID=A0A1Q8E823_9STRE|nr:carbohydrate deacetylase [Streptococcus cuniculi]OLF47942.1 carbohydrate deacetylase [Streptococcus cuniculi]
MKKVIINADDFGYSSGVNRGILESFKNGLLTSTTLMANMPGASEAIELAKAYPALGVGCHLVLTCGCPLTKGQTIASDGRFYNLQTYQEKRSTMDEEEIFEEWCTQIDFLLDQGMTLTHLDSHHHVHTFPENLAITQRISERYQLPFRNAYGLEEALSLNYQLGITGFLDLMNYPAIRDITHSFENRKDECLKELQAVLDQLKDHEVTELMVHPAFVDEELYYHSSFNIGRIKEVAILCDETVSQMFQENGIQLYHYGNIGDMEKG